MRLPISILRSAALAACVAATAPMAATPAAAQIQGEDFAKWAACSFLGYRTSPATVRREVRQAGYRNIRNLKYVNRQRPNAIGCGFYRMRAARNGRDYVVFANAFSGTVESRRPIGQRAGDRHRRPQMSEAQARRTLRRIGYDEIRSIQYRRVGRQDFYEARVVKRRAVFVVRIDDENGKVLSRKRVATLKPEHRQAGMSQQEVRRSLRQDGYRRISNIDYVRRGRNDFYTATAWKGRVQYRLRVNDTTGAVIARNRIDRRGRTGDRAEMSEREIRAELRRDGYRRISNIRYVDRGRNDYYVARAWYRGNQYRLVVSDEDGDVVNRRRVQ